MGFIANLRFIFLFATMGERFFEYLRFKGLSQKKVSELSCVSTSMISRFCKGGAIASDKLLRILQVCDDLSLEWLFYDTGKMIRSGVDSVTNNYGKYAGAEVTKDSVLVQHSRDVHVKQLASSESQAVIMEKDRLILEKDRIISERDRTIKELLQALGKV